MSFRDEINAVAKSSGQVAEEKRKASITEGRRRAEKDYVEIKKKIREKSQNGEYQIVGDKRIITFDYDYANVYSFLKSSHVWHDGIMEKGIRWEVEDEFAFDAYKSELERLSAEDEVVCELLFRFIDTDGSKYYFKIPGVCHEVNNRNTCHIMGANRFNMVIKCKFFF